MIALVTGATGCIGYALAARLVKSGEYNEVRALVRQGRDAALPPGVRPITGTLDIPTALQAAAKNVDVVFHCAAKVHDANGDADEFFHVNRDGTQNLLNACSAQNASANLPRFIFFSTVAVFGDDTPPEGLPENAPLCPQTPYAASKGEAEKQVVLWGPTGRVLRVATVYGPRDRGNLGRMMKAIAENRFVMMGDGTNRKTCANVQNVVSAAIAISKQEEIKDTYGNSIVLADPAPYTLQELHAAMYDALLKAGWKPSPQHLPRALPVPVTLALSYGVTGGAKLLGRNSPLTPAQVRRIAANNVYQTDRLSTISGYFPTGSLSQGMEEMAQWLLADGQIKGQTR